MSSGEASAEQAWGSIDAVLNAPLKNVSPDSSYLSILLMWLTLPFSLIQGIFGGLCGCVYRTWSVSGCCTIYASVVKGRPLYMAWLWWRYMIAALVALVRHGQSRFALFQWEKEACGGGEYFWQGEGVWVTSYALNSEIMQSQQDRSEAFACIRACVPDLFASGLLIFLPTGGPESEWAAVRAALHGSLLLDREGQTYQDRLGEMLLLLQESWPSPKFADLNNKALLQRSVCRCVFFMLFGRWLSDSDADILTGWRTLASTFVLPRLAQRFLFNLGIRKVKALRRSTVEIVEKSGLKDVFVAMNAGLPSQYRRSSAVKLCDEIMYVIGFAGIGGTSACVESVSQFLQMKTGEVPKDTVDFAKYPTTSDMIAAYKADPAAYVKEVCRLDPPVTSATSTLKEDLEVEMAGRRLALSKGHLRQYTLSLANRDPAVFENPTLFDPARTSSARSLTWNGEFDKGEQAYPRLCPGRYLSLQVAQAIVDHVVMSLQSGV